MGGGKCIYTCITGNYDTLIEFNKEDGWDYICFTDMDIKSDIWKIRRIPEELNDLSSVKKQRLIKVLPYKYLSEYEETIWVDANISLKKQLGEFYDICKGSNKPIVFRKHPVRTCIYDELTACVKYKKEMEQNVQIIRSRYLEEGMPENDGLYETGIIYRYNYDVHVNALMKMWAEEILNYSHRDQLSLNYCIWKLNSYDYIYSIAPSVMNEYFSINGHRKNNYSKYINKDTINIDITSIDDNIETKETRAINITQTPQILVLIEKSQFNPILTAISNELSKHFDTQIIDCRNRNYVSCYKKLTDYAKLYDWILLIKSNVSFEWASAKYFSTIISKIKEISKRTDVGIYSINNANRVSNIITSSYVKTNITQDQFLFINTQLFDMCSNLIFEDSMGFGFADYLCKLSNKLNLSTLVSIDIPLKTYTNVENYDNPTIYKLRKKFLERNPL